MECEAAGKNFKKTEILANVSMGLSACLFLTIICYHFYKHVLIQSRLYRKHKTKIRNLPSSAVRRNFRRRPKKQEMEELITAQGATLETSYTAMRSHQRRKPALDVLTPISIDDYRPAPPPCNVCTKVTHTVVPDTFNSEEQTIKS